MGRVKRKSEVFCHLLIIPTKTSKMGKLSLRFNKLMYGK